MYLFHKYLSWFLAPIRARKKEKLTAKENESEASEGNFRHNADKSLLISRMLYILGIFDNNSKANKENLWVEYNEKVNKKNYLKGLLSKYKHPRYWHY